MRYDKIEKFGSFFNKRIEFFVVCNAMQMFPNSVQSESILILGKFSPAEKGSSCGKRMRMMGKGERVKGEGGIGEQKGGTGGRR